MPAPLLYKMFKTKTEYPLHTAIRAKREDVVFLFLMEFDSQVCFISCLSNVLAHDKRASITMERHREKNTSKILIIFEKFSLKSIVDRF